MDSILFILLMLNCQMDNPKIMDMGIKYCKYPLLSSFFLHAIKTKLKSRKVPLLLCSETEELKIRTTLFKRPIQAYPQSYRAKLSVLQLIPNFLDLVCISQHLSVMNLKLCEFRLLEFFSQQARILGVEAHTSTNTGIAISPLYSTQIELL